MSETIKDGLTHWLDNAGSYPLLSDEEMIRLSKTVHTHGEDSRLGKKAVDKMVMHNLRLIPLVTKKIIYPRKDFKFGDRHTLDLLQAGTFGMHRAAQKFDYSLGYKFSTYAFMWIRQTVQRQMYVLSTAVRIPENYFRLQPKMDDPHFWAELKKEGGKTYDCTLAAFKGMRQALPLECKDANCTILTRYDSSLHVEDKKITESIDEIFDLAQEHFDPLHKQMVIDVCCFDVSLAEIAELNNMSRHAVTKIIKKTLKTLRTNDRVSALKSSYS